MSEEEQMSPEYSTEKNST